MRAAINPTFRASQPSALDVSAGRQLHRLYRMLARRHRRLRLAVFKEVFASVARSIDSRDLAPTPGRRSSELATGLIAWIAARPRVEHDYWLATTYARTLTSRQRRKQATFFTPPRLTDEILIHLEQSGLDWTTAKVLDPACGGAAFLAPITTKVAATLWKWGQSHSQICRHIERHIYGVELDPALCRISRLAIRRAIIDITGNSGRSARVPILKGDALSREDLTPKDFDLVVANPPFRKISKAEQEKRVLSWPFLRGGQQNLYSAFMGLCISKLRDGGKAALVTPTSFMSGHSFAALRSHIYTTCRVDHVHLIEPRVGVFFDVQQETTVTYLSKSKRRRSLQTPNVSTERGSGECFIGQGLIAGRESPWFLPRVAEDAGLIDVFRMRQFSLSDLGYRPLIGCYVWNRDLRPHYRTWASAREGIAPFPVIWSSHISKDLSIRYPVRSARWRGALILEMGSPDAPGIVRSPCVVLQRIASKEEKRRLKACVIPESLFRRYGGVVGENHVVFLVAKDGRPKCSPARLAEIMRTEIMDRLFRCLAGSSNVSVLELNALPFPDPAKLERQRAKGLDFEQSVRIALGLEPEHKALAPVVSA
jgi:adenine-specific DNA-methyltransferase